MSPHPNLQRRVVGAILALSMAFSLAACTGQANSATAGSTAAVPAVPSTTRSAEVAPGQSPKEAATEPATEGPSDGPTDQATDGPTEQPNAAATDAPTEAPTEAPTDAPTEEQTDVPTDQPTGQPVAPTEVLTEQPAPIATDPAGPDLVLYSLPECSVVPGGQLSGADGLTMFVAVRNAGPGEWSRLVPTAWESDTGLRGNTEAALSSGTATSALQVDLRPSDYGQTHRFTIVADPANSVVERDESNNTLQITVSLTPDAANGGNVACTSP